MPCPNCCQPVKHAEVRLVLSFKHANSRVYDLFLLKHTARKSWLCVSYLSVLVKEVCFFLLWRWGRSVSWIIDPQLMGESLHSRYQQCKYTRNVSRSCSSKAFQTKSIRQYNAHHNTSSCQARLHGADWYEVEFEPERPWLVVKVSPRLWTWKPYQSLRRLFNNTVYSMY